MVAVVAASAVPQVLTRLGERGVSAWQLGVIEQDSHDDADGSAGSDAVVREAKGVRGGAAQLVGTHPGA
jgi:hypothetical protein